MKPERWKRAKFRKMWKQHGIPDHRHRLGRLNKFIRTNQGKERAVFVRRLSRGKALWRTVRCGVDFDVIYCKKHKTAQSIRRTRIVGPDRETSPT